MSRRTWHAGPLPRDYAAELAARAGDADLAQEHKTVAPCSFAVKRAEARALKIRRELRAQGITSQTVAVEGVDANGKVVKFDSIAIAVRSLNLRCNSISEAMNRGGRTAGMLWRRVGDPWPSLSYGLQAVLNVTTGESFYSASAAARGLFPNGDRETIRRVGMGILRAAREPRGDHKEYMGAAWQAVCGKSDTREDAGADDSAAV